jgi:thiol-disulfide isomerase/thioredoxin
MITNIGTLEEIKKIVDKDPRVVILYFSALWCTPCNIFNPQLQDMEKFYNNKVLIIEINVDRFPRISNAFGIASIPTLMFFFNKILWRRLMITGADIGQTYDNVSILLTQHNDGEQQLKRDLIYNPAGGEGQR